MKLLKSVFWICILLALQSCANDKSPLLIKKWKLNDLKYTREIPEDMRPAIQQRIDILKQTYTIEYFADKTYMAGAGENLMKGTWKLNNTSTKIYSTGSDNIQREYKILELNDKEFSFEAIEGGEKVVFVLVPATEPK